MTPEERAVLDTVEGLSHEIIDFTQELVRVPTVNPPGDCYPACADLISARLKSFDYEVECLPAEGLAEHTAERPRVNVIGTLPGSLAASHKAPGQNSVLHFNGHYDVVPAGLGWTVEPFSGTLRDGRIFGRGACDQKSGIAASIYAVEAIRRSGIELDGAVEQSATPDEESGGFAGVALLCDTGRISRARQRYVVITEPLDPERVCIGHRGVYWFELITLGRIGHGGMPSLALNAAEQMATLVRAFAEQLAPLLEKRVSAVPVEPPAARRPSINLNSIHAGQALGGWQTPAVPDRCTAVFDRRFIHEESFEEVRAEIVRFLDAQGIEYELKDLMRVDPLLGSTRGVLAGSAAGAITEVLQGEARFIVSPGTYDQKHVVRRAGIQECIAYGPGRLVLAHQPDEHVAISDLIAATKVMALLTMRLLGRRT